MANFASTILLPKEFDKTHLSFGEPVPVGDKGAKFIPVKYKNVQGLKFQTPLLTQKWKVNTYPASDPSEQTKHSLTLICSNSQDPNDPEVENMVQVFKELDDTLLDLLGNPETKYYSKWFGKKTPPSREVLGALQTKMIRPARDKETGEETDRYPPSIGLKLSVYDGELKSSAYYPNKTKYASPIKEEDINNVFQPGSSVMAMARVTKVWVAGGKFGFSLMLGDALVHPPSIAPEVCPFRISDTAIDNDNVEAEIDNDNPEMDNSSNIRCDSDDEAIAVNG